MRDEIMIHSNGLQIVGVEFDPFTEGSPATRHRLDAAYEGLAVPPLERVYAVGPNPEEALRALGAVIGWGELSDFRDLESETELGEWGLRFKADGTGMKASGRYLPGGCTVMWWK